ncbi:MAG TPA: hypothetical protein VGN63_02950 [Flavisolibacter sp.]|jgi:hypothetical protein|nr:hypothetical protein [Flavisolibacter sp.]
MHYTGKSLDLNRQRQSDQTDDGLQDIFLEYRKIHQTYAVLSLTDDEALKRGLFIQWYALAEPNYLTGIADLDENAENKIIQSLNGRIEAGDADNELRWMLNYYANWDWIFERLTSFKGFNSTIANEQNNCLPDNIDTEEMTRRGQMGKYWNSLTKFSDV